MSKRVAALSLLVWAIFVSTASAQDNWLKVKSKHFTLIGNADERDIRTVGQKLEQFHGLFTQVFPNTPRASAVPLTVIVFKNKISYLPFMPTYNGRIKEVIGYFQPGQEMNYITLTSDSGTANSSQVLYHELVHALTHDANVQYPLWLIEGLAEFYSTCELTDQNASIKLGTPLGHHLQQLRENQLLPLAQLFAVNHNSPTYNEHSKHAGFYAQSWALVHYLMLGDNGQKQAQNNQLIKMMLAGTPLEEAVSKAFQADSSTLEKELKAHVNRRHFSVLRYNNREKLAGADDLTTVALTPAEANYHLGDLLAQQNRKEAEDYLRTAIELDPALVSAQALYGKLLIQAGQLDKAQQVLEKAATCDRMGNSHWIYYYYALAMLRDKAEPKGQLLSPAFERQKAPLIRASLQRAIAINPNFTESYNLLSFVNLVLGEELQETAEMLKQALQLVPGDQLLSFQLAQLYKRQDKNEEAKKLLEFVARTATQPALRQQAQLLLNELSRVTARPVHFVSYSQSLPVFRRADKGHSGTARPVLRQLKEGEFVRGQLTRRECSAQGTTFYVTAQEQQFVFHTNRVDRLKLINYTMDASVAMACKNFTPAQPVRVVYRSSINLSSGVNGEPVEVEFITPGRAISRR